MGNEGGGSPQVLMGNLPFGRGTKTRGKECNCLMVGEGGGRYRAGRLRGGLTFYEQLSVQHKCCSWRRVNGVVKLRGGKANGK